VGGYSATSSCPVCGAELPSQPKRFGHSGAGVQRKLAREPIAAAAARRTLGGVLQEVEDDVHVTAALLVTELVANSVLHAGPDAGEHLVLEVSVMPDRVRVEVRDSGCGFVPTPRQHEDPLALHWGLHLVERLASRWDVEQASAGDETVVWFELDRSNAA
jgi:anti-sigma regulatory factor (Ser/Thr protein kinase)